MNLKLIYPKWPKLPNQPEFNLPPIGPVTFAATLPERVNIDFCDENVEPLDLTEKYDLYAISCMLTCQAPRAFAIADEIRASGGTVMLGGIAVMLHAEEAATHADSIFLGEAEGRMEQVLQDFEAGKLKKVYNYLGDFPDTALIGPARRDILKHELYNYRGVQMVDLFHASRGCRFNCFPCCTPYLGGRRFRPRPIDKVVEEMSGIKNNRLFIVDNSLAQDDQWEKNLFRAIAPLGKKWISHPIKDSEEILKLAAEAGAWYVYQAVFDTSDYIRDRIKRYKDHGIGVEGTVILGTDEQSLDDIKRLVDFLLEIDLDLAEFTVLTPFPHSSICDDLEKQGRILHHDWSRYTAGEVVFKPAKMTVDELQNAYQYAWDTFYRDCSMEFKMAKLYLDVMKKERGENIAPLQINKKRWGK
ncbi:MAG: hypothetical protein PHV75_02205 [Victivallaceae bacterium]|nr:hypothetical protein [Victivallaceae bacterium]MDD4317312.1 hypothetical protein [Victivallaceae bacterium]